MNEIIDDSKCTCGVCIQYIIPKPVNNPIPKQWKNDIVRYSGKPFINKPYLNYQVSI